MFPDQGFGRPNFAVVQGVILRQFNLRLKPELRFAVRVVHMHVKAGFLAREEEPESILSKDRGAPRWAISVSIPFSASVSRRGPE